jgi:GNAT superfamily N-acetyltransferase
MDFRRATQDDIEDLVRLRVAMQEELRPSPDPEAFAASLREYLKRSDALISWVAVHEQRAVACASVLLIDGPPTGRNLSGRQGYVLNVYTEPGYRRSGIAATLCARVVEDAAAAGVTRLFLRAVPGARTIYERLGFTADSHTIFMVR